ncbi:MAG: PAC2 family protein [Demequina sp.]|nr:PAC2 family protein [Demequina sp.]
MTWDNDGVEQWASASGSDAVLLQSLRGFVDAGRVGKLIRDHVVSMSEPVRVVTFNVDELLDYRSRRPEMTFSINEWTAYDEPYLAIDMVRDAEDQPFLMLHGSEPDIRWELFISSVREAVKRLGVGLTVGAYGIPMGVPHTKPMTSTTHGTRQDLLRDSPGMFGTVNVPASAQNLLEYRFGQWSLDAVNVAVHVPYYLAQSSLPQAAQHALIQVEGLTGLSLDPSRLDGEAGTAMAEIVRQMAESEEVQGLVATLEAQYEAMETARRDGIEVDGPLPTADELGAEFEKFLAQQRRDLPPND